MGNWGLIPTKSKLEWIKIAMMHHSDNRCLGDMFWITSIFGAMCIQLVMTRLWHLTMRVGCRTKMIMVHVVKVSVARCHIIVKV